MARVTLDASKAVDQQAIEEIKELMWGPDIKHDVFRRWTQGKRTIKTKTDIFAQFFAISPAVLKIVPSYMSTKIVKS